MKLVTSRYYVLDDGDEISDTLTLPTLGILYVSLHVEELFFFHY